MNSKPVRISPDFETELRDLARLRIKNEVDRKFRSIREMSEMVLRCPSFPNIKKELSTIPKKEDLTRGLK